jgi:zinc D-Ala-D-Ala carboxypeptidase
MQLSSHFSLEELTFSQTASRSGIANVPSVPDIENLRRLCVTVLEPARTLLGVPLHVDSGYRSAILNKLVGGALTSAHMEGRAADVVPIGISLLDAFARLRASSIPFDQVILECQAWIHLSVSEPAVDGRREALLASGTPGHWSYVNA